MKAIALLFLVAFSLLIVSGILLVWWRLKKQKTILWMATVAILTAFILGCWTLYQFADKSYDKLSGSFKKRSGIEIYNALLGTPVNECIEVIKFKDQLVPKLDVAILLYCNVCDEELNRLVRRYHFKKDTIPFNEEMLSEQPEWLNEVELGDSVITYRAVLKPGKNWQNIYVSLDGKKVLIEDILD
ncbi:MAG: hypothetical protein N4A35_04195 [Flavobacteriales bacterium]|jgi:hypothetical protein|nr:hypothetical protein [Flavobacteriales bacterium]